MTILCLTLIAALLWFAASLVLRRRFQFGISSLLLLAIAIAIPCGTFSVRVARINHQNAILAKLSTGCLGSIRWRDAYVTHLTTFNAAVDPAPPGMTDEEAAYLSGLSGLEELTIIYHDMTDIGFGHLKKLERLRTLNVSYPISAEGLAQLKEMNQLEHLTLDYPSITEECAKELQEALPNCEIIH